MKPSLAVLIAILALPTLSAQQSPYQIPNASVQKLVCIGSSTAFYACNPSYGAPAVLVNVSSATWEVPLSFPSKRCNDILQFTRFIPPSTTIVFVQGVGIVDVENRADGTRPSTPVDEFMACAIQLTQQILGRCSCAVYWTDVNPMNIAATDVNGNNGPYTDPRQTVAAYNSAMTDPQTGIVAQFPGQPVFLVLIHDQLSDSSGFAMSNLVNWTDPTGAAWPIIFQQHIGSGLYALISAQQYQ